LRRIYFFTKHEQGMRKGMPFGSSITQLVLSFAVLFVVYIVLALLDFDEVGLVSGLGFLVFQPIVGFFATVVTIFICFILGLPIRFNSRFGRWWKANPYVPVIGVIISFLLMSLAFTQRFVVSRKVLINEVIMEKEVPNIFMIIAGWFILGFCLLHFYPHAFVNLFRRQKGLSRY
jgi:hypothetical protein